MIMAGYTTAGYITVWCGDRMVLVDTGTPVTLARTAAPFQFGAMRVEPMVPPFDFDEASRLGGVPFDAIVGNDALARQSFTLTKGGGFHFEVRRVDRSPRTLVLPFERRRGGLVCRGGLGPTPVDAIIDTGAVISLAPGAWLDAHGGELVGERQEFYQSMERWVEFVTPVYHVAFQVGAEVRTVTMGRVPAASAAMMQALAGTAFVVGTDLLLQCEVLTYDAARQIFTVYGG